MTSFNIGKMQIKETTTPKKPYPNLLQAWLLVLLLFPAILFAYLLQHLLLVFDINESILNLFSYVISFGLWASIAFYIKSKQGDHPFIHYKAKVSVLLYLLLIPATVALLFIVDMIGETILPKMPEDIKAMFEKAMDINIYTILTVVVAAPIFEEILCRGVIFEGLSKNYSVSKAMVWSAIIFATIHLNPWQALPAFIMGLFLAWIYHTTRSILPCIFIHFINNLLAVLSHYYFYKHLKMSQDLTTAELLELNPWFMIFICLCVFSLSLFAISRLKTNTNN